MVGRGRRNPARLARSVDQSGQSLDLLEEVSFIYNDECIRDRVDECTCGGQGLYKGTTRGDAAEDADEDIVCVVCARAMNQLTPRT